MATDRIALCRPINYAAITNAVTVGDTGGTHVHWSFPANATYWGLPGLMDALQTTIAGTFANSTVTLNTDYKIVVHLHSSLALAFSDDTFRDALGFTGDRTAATDHTANYRPEWIWVSTYAPSDQTDFYWNQQEVWQGRQALDGTWAGNLQTESIAAGTNWRMKKDLTLHFEAAKDVFFASPATANYDSARSLEYFVLKSRMATAATDASPQSTGMFLFYDADNVKDPISHGYMLHGPMTTLTNSNTYQYCTCGPSGMSIPKNALPAGKSRYNVSLQLTTASPTVTWTGW
jgi:hypothetical protein